jgi:hypothetical protein
VAAQRQARPGEINGDGVDRFTIGHAAFGVLMGLGRVPLWAAVAVAVGWELIENPLKDRFPEAFPHASHDTFENASMDAIAMVAGWGAVQFLPPEPGSRG